jgi:hypothetical protein
MINHLVNFRKNDSSGPALKYLSQTTLKIIEKTQKAKVLNKEKLML